MQVPLSLPKTWGACLPPVRTSLSCSFAVAPDPDTKTLAATTVNLPCMASLSAPTSKSPSLATAVLQSRPYTLRGTPISSKLPVVSPTSPPKLPPHRFYICTSKRFPWRRSACFMLGSSSPNPYERIAMGSRVPMYERLHVSASDNTA